MCRRRSAWSTTSISWPRAASSPRALQRRSARAPSPSSTSSSTANPRARCRSTMPRPSTAPISRSPPPDMPIVAALRQQLERLGANVTSHVWRLGFASRFLAYLVMHSGTALRRFHLTIAEIYFAGVLSLIVILVSALFSAMGIFGGYLVGVQLIGVDAGAFWSQMQAAVDLRDDIVNGVIKSIVFGIAVTWIAVFEGYDAPPTAEGVSRATTRTVVTSSLAVLALDFVLTALMFTGGGHAQ